MRYYFTLQLRRLQRWFAEIGIHPIIGISLSILGFALASKYLFFKIEYAVWIYASVALISVFKLNEKSRNQRLTLLFTKKDKMNIRLVENVLALLSFLIYLLYEGQYVWAIGLLSLSLILVFLDFNFATNRSLPTPFRNFPFENIVGFRKSILAIVLAYSLMIKGIQVDNYNLALASMGLIYFVFMSFYVKPESIYFSWIFSNTAQGFLKNKIIDAAICNAILIFPGFIALCIFFPSMYLFSIALLLIGNIFLISMILAKYSAYPKEINLPQALLFGLSLWFPPMLLITIVIFYRQSIRNLKTILE